MSTYIDPNTEAWIEQLQARIAEVEAENAIFRNADYDALQCGSRIAELQAENAKLKEALEKAAKCLYERTQSCPSDMFDWDHPETCDIECNTHSHVDDAWKCWLDWLMGHE